MSQPSSSTTQPPSPTVAPVAEAALDGLLLSPDEIDTAMGATAMTVAGAYAGTDTTAPTCRTRPACPHRPDGRHGLCGADGAPFAGRSSREPGDPSTHLSIRLWCCFPSRDAAAFFTASAQRWPACSNRQYTLTQPGQPDLVWTVGPVTNTNGTLSATQTTQGGNGWACERALTVPNNVAIDIAACSYTAHPADSAVNIATDRRQSTHNVVTFRQLDRGHND